MSTKKTGGSRKKRPATPRRALRNQRVLWLAQDIFARSVTIPGSHSTDTLARAALQAANLFWTIVTEKP